MSELLPITFTSILLGILSHINSIYDPDTLTYRRKDNVFFAVLVFCMAVFVGLRTDYNDTRTYTYGYEMMAVRDSFEDIFSNISWKLGDNPGFEFINNILKYLGASAQTYLMFYAVITVWINLWFLRKYSCNFAWSVFLYVTFSGYTFALAAIKQCIATAFCLIATDRHIRKKNISFVLFVLLGSLFHPYALMYLILPFFRIKPWSGRSIFTMAAAGFTGFALEPLLGTIVDITTVLGENYTIDSFNGDGINVFRLAAVSVPLLLAFLVQKGLQKDEVNTQDLMVNLSMLNAEIMFIGLFGTANYFGRLANYFQPFQALAIPWLLSFFDKNTRKILTYVAILCYTVFFIYSMVYTGSFDSQFNRISLMEYIDSLFTN